MDTETLASERERAEGHPRPTISWARKLGQTADSYGLVLALVILAYVMDSVAIASPWWRLWVSVLNSLTLFIVLRTSRSPQHLVFLAGIILVLGTVVGALSILIPPTRNLADFLSIFTGVLLIIAPVAIAIRIFSHQFVTVETLLGAICIYVLIGYAFASIFGAIARFSPTPFFTGVPHAAHSDFLFFSYTTLTTVGYGNLVPEVNVGQTLAMLEALLGQIYLVIVVARLVSLWGLEIPRAAARKTSNMPPEPPSSDGLAR
jgi:hypothetical protein